MTISSVDRFRSDQRSLLQDIKTCNEDLVHHRIASDSSIRKSEQSLRQSSAEAIDIFRKLAKLIESADRDFQRQLGSEEWSTGTEECTEEEIELRIEHSEMIAEKYQPDFAVITNAFNSLAERSRFALEDALGLSRDVTVFQVTLVAPVNQQRRTVLKDLQDSISAAKQNVDILIDKKKVLERQIVLANDRARAAGLEANSQEIKRHNGILGGSIASGGVAYTTLAAGVLLGPVGWIVGGMAVVTSATTTAIYAVEKKERIERHGREQQSHQNEAARLGQELSQASSTKYQLEAFAIEYESMGQQLIAMERDVQKLQTAAAHHQDNMKQEVNKSTDNYLEMSQAAAQMSEVGYCTEVRVQLLQLVSRIGEGNHDR